METVGLVVAMSQEIRPLHPYARAWKQTEFGKFPGYRFELSGRECHLVSCGIGLERAIRATRALLANVRPELLVSFGVGGGVEDDLDVGDMVLGRESCTLNASKLGSFRPLALLPDHTREAISQALNARGAKLVWGTIVTTPGSQTIPARTELLHPVLDMETAGVAQVAREADIPLLAFRTLSDTPQKPIPFDIEAFTSGTAGARLVRISRTILQHPGIIFQMIQLGHNTEKAAQNAALALATGMGQPLPGEDKTD